MSFRPSPTPGEAPDSFTHPHTHGTFIIGNLAFELSHDGPRDDPQNIDFMGAYVCGTHPLTVDISAAVLLLVQNEVLRLEDIIRTREIFQES